jgi:hypothetical protein
VQHWRELDTDGQLAAWFEAPSENELARQEEGWILGVPSSRTIDALRLGERSRGSRPTRRRAPAAPAPLSPGPSTGRAPCLCGCGDYPRGKRFAVHAWSRPADQPGNGEAFQRPLTDPRFLITTAKDRAGAVDLPASWNQEVLVGVPVGNRRSDPQRRRQRSLFVGSASCPAPAGF